MEKKRKTLKIINVFSLVLTVICSFGAILKVIKTKMDLNNPIVSDNFVNNLVFQDVIKAVVIFGVIYFQFKLYKRKEYLT